MSTNAIYEERLLSVTWHSLTRTYQDAVIITRALGVGYIWIDSICIIQDWTEDWISETTRMGGIYRGALLVISASYATDVSMGCLADRRGVFRIENIGHQEHEPAETLVYPNANHST